MGGLFGGGKPDTSAAEAQIRAQQAETDRLRVEAEKDKVKLAEDLAAKRTARQRGGVRALLAEERLNPETGVSETLGSAGGL
jgi:Spy/CpxP family protein refolding chaperone